ncbi:MAG: hypothetical protein LUE08_03475 [Akkermansiaceae bacterium]|nr:hypothetical protein [Akkermansiaceae bacterium]
MMDAGAKSAELAPRFSCGAAARSQSTVKMKNPLKRKRTAAFAVLHAFPPPGIVWAVAGSPEKAWSMTARKRCVGTAKLRNRDMPVRSAIWDVVILTDMV